MAETKKYVICTIDNEWDDCVEEIGAFEGTEEELKDYAYSLLPEMLEEEDLDNIEYISRGSNVSGGEAWGIVRTDSHKTCFVKPFETPEFKTLFDISEKGRDFIETYPDGVQEYDMFDLKR